MTSDRAVVTALSSQPPTIDHHVATIQFVLLAPGLDISRRYSGYIHVRPARASGVEASCLSAEMQRRGAAVTIGLSFPGASMGRHSGPFARTRRFMFIRGGWRRRRWRATANNGMRSDPLPRQRRERPHPCATRARGLMSDYRTTIPEMQYLLLISGVAAQRHDITPTAIRSPLVERGAEG